ncbi:MAG TPA: prepilin-type N-terminal cleavage/methylation domain-containing protein, partial [Cellvibrionaceae bacterium]
MVIPSQQAQRGFSLVELMIAITIGLVLMTGVVQMFLSSKTVFSTQQGISRIQETGRMAMEFMAKDIREAGYQGCMSRMAINYFSTLSDSADRFLYDFET